MLSDLELYYALTAHLCADVAKTILEMTQQIDDDTINRLAKNGHIDLLLAFRKNKGIEFNRKMSKYAVRGNQLETLKILHKNRTYPDRDIIYTALNIPNYEIIDWLFEQGYGKDNSLWHIIGRSGDLKIMQLARKHGININVHKELIEYGHTHMLDWLIETGRPAKEDLMYVAIKSGRINSVKWVLEHGADWENYFITLAEEKGHTHLVEWLQENKFHYMFKVPLY